jgi:hypothetical protein
MSNTPRHRRPDRERTNPASEYYVPNDPANRAAKPPTGHRPANIPRRTLLEASADLGGTVEGAKLQKRLQQAADENGGYPEETDCPLCGQSAMLVGPGQVDCLCRPEVFHAGTELAKLRGERNEELRMIHECMREDQDRGQPGGSGSSNGRTRKKPQKIGARHTVRIEQDEPLFGAEPKFAVKVEKVHKGSRKDITLLTETKDMLSDWAAKQSRDKGKRVTMADGIRQAISTCLSKLKNVREFELWDDKTSLQIYFFADELELVDSACHPDALGVTRGEIVEACLQIWIPTATERKDDK